jgi:hypothetical protein
MPPVTCDGYGVEVVLEGRERVWRIVSLSGDLPDRLRLRVSHRLWTDARAE